MRILIAAAAMAMTGAGAQAATVDLTYTVEAVVTEVRLPSDLFNYPEFKYSGPEAGESATLSFQITVDTESPDSFTGNPPNSATVIGDFDINTGAVTYYDQLGDDYFTARLLPSGGGTVRDFQTYFANPNIYSNVEYNVLSYEVDGLPMAPVPLPATAPLLLLGVAGFAAMRRRQRGAPA